MRNQQSYDNEKYFHLPEDIMSFIKPIFKDPSEPFLIKKCFIGKSQNQNKSFNNAVWSFLPKKHLYLRIHCACVRARARVCV